MAETVVEVDYKDGVAYWSKQTGDVNGMLGGYGPGSRVPRMDIQHSERLLRGLLPLKVDDEEVKEGGLVMADCGCGIGRITLDLLSRYAATVDMVEPCVPFTKQMAEGEAFAPLREAGKIGEILTSGLQDWHPEKAKYHIIWNQWCLGQLSYEDLVAYLKRCKASIKKGGYVVVKENLSGSTTDIFDDQDSSWTRSQANWLQSFKDAGLTVHTSSLQHGFPQELFKVKAWALY
jgi:protein N-terminal methyltransferase